MEERFILTFNYKELRVYDNKVVFVKKNVPWWLLILFGIVTFGVGFVFLIIFQQFFKGYEKTIPIKYIKSIEFCEPSFLFNGHLSLNIKDSTNYSMNSSNMIVFPKKQYETARAIRDYVESIILQDK